MLVNEIDAKELNQWMDDGKPLKIIDVRENIEVARGTIEGAEHIPMRSIPVHLEYIEQTDPVIIICRSGVRSHHVCAYLAERGFENTLNLKGGVIAWVKSGFEFQSTVAVA